MGGKVNVLEYSEIDEERAKELNQKNELKYYAGNMVNIIMKLDFIMNL